MIPNTFQKVRNSVITTSWVVTLESWCGVRIFVIGIQQFGRTAWSCFVLRIVISQHRMMNPLSVGLSMFQKFAEVSIALTLSLDSMRAQFNLAASAGGEFNDQLNNERWDVVRAFATQRLFYLALFRVDFALDCPFLSPFHHFLSTFLKLLPILV